MKQLLDALGLKQWSNILGGVCKSKWQRKDGSWWQTDPKGGKPISAKPPKTSGVVSPEKAERLSKVVNSIHSYFVSLASGANPSWLTLNSRDLELLMEEIYSDLGPMEYSADNTVAMVPVENKFGSYNPTNDEMLEFLSKDVVDRIELGSMYESLSQDAQKRLVSIVEDLDDKNKNKNLILRVVFNLVSPEIALPLLKKLSDDYKMFRANFDLSRHQLDEKQAGQWWEKAHNVSTLIYSMYGNVNPVVRSKALEVKGEGEKNYAGCRSRFLSSWSEGDRGVMAAFSVAASYLPVNKGKSLWLRRAYKGGTTSVASVQDVETLHRLYKETQEFFARAGVTKVKLYRGMKSVKQELGMMESWTSAPSVTDRFGPYLLSVEVPVSAILTCWQSAVDEKGRLFSIPHEEEYIVLGGGVPFDQISIKERNFSTKS